MTETPTLPTRLTRFLLRTAALTVLMFVAWVFARALLPQGALRPYFSRLFSTRVGTLVWWRVLAANLVPFLGIGFMNLFRVGRRPGGAYVLPLFWIMTGVIYGTNSLVFAGHPVPLSVAVLWQRTGFTELVAYSFDYEGSITWQVWEGLWRTTRIRGACWLVSRADACFWLAGLGLLVLSAVREAA